MGLQVVTHQVMYPYCSGLGLMAVWRVEAQDTTESDRSHHPVVPEGIIVPSCCDFRFLENFSWLVLIIISFFVISPDRMKLRNVFLHFSLGHGDTLGTQPIVLQSSGGVGQ